MYSREQILITNQFVSTLKAWEKAVVRNYGTHDTGYHQLLLFSRDWFEAKDRQLKARLAREQLEFSRALPRQHVTPPPRQRAQPQRPPPAHGRGSLGRHAAGD